MKIFFRTDSSSQIGSGHVIRCLTLAKLLKKLKAECKFICRDHNDNLIKKIKEEGFDVIILPGFKQKNKAISTKGIESTYSNWLGESWNKDATQTINALSNKKIDWLIIDHYAIDERWEKKLRSSTKKIMVIDDLANRNHDCDILLDQNLVANFKNRYQNLLPTYCTTLLGPQYALLQNEYKDAHLIAPPRVGPTKNILVYFGGTDQNNLTEMTLSAFVKLNREDINLDVVISSNNPQKEKIKKLGKNNKNIKINIDLKSLAPLMLKADIAIGGCGATSWERCCLGLPSIVITIAENQKLIAKELNKLGLIRWLGHCHVITKNSIFDALETSIDHNFETCSNACKLITDGCGTQKVASFLLFNSKTKLQTRLAQIKDEILLQNLSKFNNKIISVDKFRKSFYSSLRNQDCCKIYILEIDEGLPICQVQFNLTKDGWTINYTQEKFVRSLKLERYFIENALSKFRIDQNGSIVFAGIEKINKNFKKNRFSISICSEKTSWINNSIPSLLFDWINRGHDCNWVHNANHLLKGDICFYLSYEKIVKKEILGKFKNNLVVHASDLPRGKGWSPLSWQILERNKDIKITLIEAEDKVDSGKIYMQLSKKFNGYELIDELRSSVMDITLQLCSYFVDKYPEILRKAKAQNDKETFYLRRFPEDSKLDLNKSLKEQFNLLRVVDNKRYPAYFEIDGHKYYLLIKTDRL
jgi:UDP-2,4-diacetamido-2,4,6-trideoxy-beta-L-altropyranose hydrolase